MAANEQRPRYRVLEKSYIDDVLLDPERMPYEDGGDTRKPLFVEFDGIPGPHLEAANNAARKMCTEHADKMKAYDVLGALPIAQPVMVQMG